MMENCLNGVQLASFDIRLFISIIWNEAKTAVGLKPEIIVYQLIQHWYQRGVNTQVFRKSKSADQFCSTLKDSMKYKGRNMARFESEVIITHHSVEISTTFPRYTFLLYTTSVNKGQRKWRKNDLYRAVQWHCSLNVRKYIFERKHRKSSRNFSSIVNK